MFTFNKNYDDLEQVAPFLPDFAALHAEETAAGRYPYNDSFKGRIAGIVGPCEDTAIYLLQGLLRDRATQERINACLADGFERIETIDAVTKFSRVIVYARQRGHSMWKEYRDARLVPETKPNQRAVTGGIYALLPKGKRTNGVAISGNHVLAKR